MGLKPYLASAAVTSAVLRRHDLTLQKKYGQNFLIDEAVSENIVKACGVAKDDHVLEIGPGIGTLTQYLSRDARSVTAVEIDKKLIPVLEDTLRGFDNVEVINADILKTDIARIAKEKNGEKPIKVAANLPYYITTPIILKLLKEQLPIESITVMVQKEAADRMIASPGSGEYGALSLAVRYFSKPKIAFYVGPESFMPRPKVGSAVVCLEKYEKPAASPGDEELMFEVIRASFDQRRKTLLNALSNSAKLKISKQQAKEALCAIGKPENARGETLSLSEFAALSDEILRLQNTGDKKARG